MSVILIFKFDLSIVIKHHFYNIYIIAGEESEAYCASPIYTGLTGKVAVPQHVNYSGRGPLLRHFSLYCYTAIVSVVPKTILSNEACSDDPIDDDQVVKPGAGRKCSSRYPFDASHPLTATHEQQLRSKPSIPYPVSIPPKPPGKRCAKLTEAWMTHARKFAKYILILFRPWQDNDGQLPGELSWHALCVFLRELRVGKDGSGQTILDRVRETWIRNVSRGMRMSAAPRVAASQYRKRKATRPVSVWTRPDGTTSLGKKKRREDFGSVFDDNDEDLDCNPNNGRGFDPDDPQTIIDAMRLEASADDQLKIKKSKELAYYAATTAALDDILSNSDTPNATSPSVTCVDVERALFSPSSSQKQLESIIEDLKIDPKKKIEKTKCVFQTT